MASDYQAITERNVEEYGKGTRHLEFIANLYPNRTHFIFELIQNAEDAGAHYIGFHLFGDRLEIRHDGRLFSPEDVVGICGVGEGTKAEDLTKIGKFGVGFKSVYKYTTTPHVYSGDENFCIEKFVRPKAVEHIAIDPMDTLFVLPFDRINSPAEVSVEEIAAGLSQLDTLVLLFLHNLEAIHLGGDRVESRSIVRETLRHSSVLREVELKQLKQSGERDVTDWLVWERPIDPLDDVDTGEGSLRVEVAFSAVKGDNGLEIHACSDAPLVVFLPTEKETNLGFLIQGPYQTTPARDNIREDSDWNNFLVTETALLMVQALVEMREVGWLSVTVLSSLPLLPSRFPLESVFRPLFDLTLRAFAENKLLPLHDGGFGRSEDVVLARGQGLRELLAPKQLKLLFGTTTPVAFISDEVSEFRTRILWDYLRDQLKIEVLTPEKLINALKLEFIKAQSDSWLKRFYEWLAKNNGEALTLLRQRDSERQSRRWILRLDDNSQVSLYKGDGKPAAYLPGAGDTNYRTIKENLADTEELRTFFAGLGFTQPDQVSEIIEFVLPTYENAQPSTFDRAQHAGDIGAIIKALIDFSGEQRRRLEQALRRTRFLIGRTADESRLEFKRFDELYVHSKELDVFFEENPEIWFIDQYSEDVVTFFTELGLRTSPGTRTLALGWSGKAVVLDKGHGFHRRGLEGFDPTYEIDGLAYAFRHPSLARSEYIWNRILCRHPEIIEGEIEESSRQEYINSSTHREVSKIGRDARDQEWVPDKNGVFHRPAHMTLDDLPSQFQRFESLAKALGMSIPVFDDASAQTGIPAQVLKILSERPDFCEEILRMAQISSSDNSSELDEKDADDLVEDVNFADELNASFEVRSLGHEADHDDEPEDDHGQVGNSEFRGRRIREGLEEAQGAEPPRSSRFRRVPMVVWEARNGQTRHFLIEQYGGRCQICGETFLKRSGDPYFEGTFLVSRLRGRWLDRPGNIVCLCANCCAKFEYGRVEADGLIGQIQSWSPQSEGGTQPPILSITLCGQPVQLRYQEKHLLDLQVMVNQSLEEDQRPQ